MELRLTSSSASRSPKAMTLSAGLASWSELRESSTAAALIDGLGDFCLRDQRRNDEFRFGVYLAERHACRQFRKVAEGPGGKSSQESEQRPWLRGRWLPRIRLSARCSRDVAFSDLSRFRRVGTEPLAQSPSAGNRHYRREAATRCCVLTSVGYSDRPLPAMAEALGQARRQGRFRLEPSDQDGDRICPDFPAAPPASVRWQAAGHRAAPTNNRATFLDKPAPVGKRPHTS